MEQQREQWGSRIGFILAAAGSAVGLGNIWKFPYVTGLHGGGAFVVIYILMVAAIGFTVMLAEFSIGRLGQRNAPESFQRIKGGLWPLVGWMGIGCGTLVLSYYAIIGGWTIKYIIDSFSGLMAAAAAGKAAEVFSAFTTDSPAVILYQLAFMAVTTWVVFRGIGEGIERCSKVLMPALFVIMIVLTVRSVTLEGAGRGIEYYLKPDFSQVTASTWLAALGQAFFSLSLGMGAMITYGSYLNKDVNMAKAAAQVCVLDTMVALLAGMVIFPAVFAFNVEPGAGPGLTFITLPGVFAQMPGGSIWSALFFLLLFVAALTSAISLLEGSVSYIVDKGVSRSKAAWGMGVAVFILGLPSSISLAGGLNIYGKGFFDAAGYLTDAVLMPLGSIFVCLFAGWAVFDQIKKEVTNNGTHTFHGFSVWCLLVKYAAPVAMLAIFLTGLQW